MNERIRELYQQAHMVREYPADDPWRGGNPPTVYWGGERSAEKFALLIVQECCDIFVELRTRPADLAAKDVKKHFGIEE